MGESDLDQLILAGANADLLSVLHAGLPVGVGMVGDQQVALRTITFALFIKQDRVEECRLCDDCVGAGLIQCHGVEGGEHAYVRSDGGIVFGVAVAIGGEIQHQRDVEAGTAVHDCLGVLGDLLV